uniref:Uncharacterized protein n=1 Tax=Chromera velia CCMP2878 TaxID=1169474 RepID=A0A0G4HBN8_9ALVE|eukprot:Cvel_6231.t1-p1 / transcript=Cvel_6231.t1 / gene=Cvel_6231 / organism=Chromera_velia_CCMP2878 / gene_product=hypothetical protein / transcript_product=hypothetical protein / location=Cvel_scaffold301:76056-79473(+) / protein_length=159 / sequence_SO=supercontig / SO=protein_coding / is_pseudo=false
MFRPRESMKKTGERRAFFPPCVHILPSLSVRGCAASEEFYNVASDPEQVDELRTKVAGLMVNEMTGNPKSPLEGANGDHPAFSTTTPVVAAKVVTTTTAVHTPTVINAAPTTVVAHAAVPVVHIAHALPVVHVVRGGTGFLDKDKKAEPTAQKAEAGKK